VLTSPPAEADDADLMRRVAEHDPAGLAGIYDRHATLLHSVLLKMLADPAEAQDLLHDLFLSLPQKASNYDPSLGKPIAWLITLARHRAIDQLRRRSTHERFVRRSSGESDGSQPAFSGPHDDEKAVLYECVRRLPDDQRQTLHLAYFGGFTQQEIAEQLAQPLGTVKARIRRGLLKLRDCLEGRL
jgi:RNA polymerase sigma-70 factor, ECF subfamily